MQQLHGCHAAASYFRCAEDFLRNAETFFETATWLQGWHLAGIFLADLAKFGPRLHVARFFSETRETAQRSDRQIG